MGYKAQGLGNRNQGILSPIVVEQRVKHEGLGFYGKKEKATNTKITFVKEKYMVELACSFKERVAANKGGNTPPLHPYCDRLHKGSDENTKN
jgi:hypothetical protein